MTDTNLKDFLMCGAFLQIGPDHFRLLIGPFEKIDELQLGYKRTTLLYKPEFWDFLTSSTDIPQNSVYSATTSHVLSREEFIQFLASLPSQKPEIQWKSVNEMQFRTQFDWSQNNFREKQLLKTVPIIRQQGAVAFTAENLQWCIQNLIQNKMFGWSYGFFENSEGFVGHTPEILAQWSSIDRRLHTVALAGTYPKTANAFDEMIQDEKIINEHQLVIDDIVNKLENLSFHSKVEQGETDILELKYLLHLMTEFELEV